MGYCCVSNSCELGVAETPIYGRDKEDQKPCFMTLLLGNFFFTQPNDHSTETNRKTSPPVAMHNGHFGLMFLEDCILKYNLP